MKVSEFMNKELVDYASYSTVRMLGSAIDGQKNAARKILKTVLDKNINSEIKVSQFGSKISEYTEYLHGSIDGVVVTMAKNYPGTNNIPLLDREGNFGSRFIPDASAPRYIYTNGSKELFKLFNKDDTEILDKQYFEGNEIEPKFYLPVLPILLINGSDGIASGFKQVILPRNPKKIKQYILDHLNNNLRPKSSNSLEPYFEGFTGTVELGKTDRQWLIKGAIKRISITKIEITEIPVGIALKDYLSILDDLEDNKVILGYKDKSENNIFNFEVSFLSSTLKSMTDDELLNTLGLVKTVSEIYTAINADMRVQVFDSAKEIIDYYIGVKMKYLQKRKDHLLQKMDSDIRFDTSKYLFIKNIVEDKLIINKRKKDDIVKDLAKIENIITRDDSYDYLLNMSIQSLTEERMKRLLQDIKETKTKLDVISNTSLEKMWQDEL